MGNGHSERISEQTVLLYINVRSHFSREAHLMHSSSVNELSRLNNPEKYFYVILSPNNLVGRAMLTIKTVSISIGISIRWGSGFFFSFHTHVFCLHSTLGENFLENDKRYGRSRRKLNGFIIITDVLELMAKELHLLRMNCSIYIFF